MAFGALPAAAVGVQGRRRSRFVVLIVGVCIGLGLVTGAALGKSWLLAVGGIFLLCLGAAVLSAHTRVGLLLMTLPMPMAGAGLSFDGDVTAATELAALIAAGAVCGWLLCLCWPESPTTARTTGTLPGQTTMVEYGVRLGLAGAVCAGLGFALDLDHKGWATAACLLVMRPTPEMTKLRGAGRAISVSVGAFAACVLTAQAVDTAVVAAAVVVALTCLAALRTSRWYLTGGFTTFILILLLVYQSPEQAHTRFFERLVETVVGVGIALFFGVALPSMRRQRTESAAS